MVMHFWRFWAFFFFSRNMHDGGGVGVIPQKKAHGILYHLHKWFLETFVES
jgi:hypothetical protein